jgi:formylglycine-generating enzyme required for sulfatase activity
MKKQMITLVALAMLVSHAALAADGVTGMKTLEAADWAVPGIDLKMKLLPAGTFTMGSPEKEEHRRDDEVRHKVKISKPFYMGVYEVTQRQFYKLMMPKDYDHKVWQYKRGPLTQGAAFHYRKRPVGHNIMFRDSAVTGPLTDLNPMECITWARASEFCLKVTEAERKAGRLPDGYVYRLPTEAEWEYACRAGTKGPYNVDIDCSDIKNLGKFAYYDDVNWWVTYTSEVGKDRLPNAWGLYDMHGNVYEWCYDWYGSYEKGRVTDPFGPAEGKEKVVRGGCFYLTDENAPTFLRSGCRYSLPPDIDFNAIVGMRLVLAPAIEGASTK